MAEYVLDIRVCAELKHVVALTHQLNNTCTRAKDVLDIRVCAELKHVVALSK